MRVILRADFDDLRSTVGPRSQLGSCSVVIVVRLLRISASLGQWNDLWKEFSENRPVLATRTCVSNCVMKKDDFEEVPN